MEKYQLDVIIALLACSAAVLLVPAVVFCVRRIFVKPSCGAYKRATGSSLLVFSACLIISVWCLRYAVGYFSIISAEGEAHTLTWWEEIFNSLVHALQTFSMDEDYTGYILDGKIMLGTLLGGNSLWITVYGAYAAILNAVAPIAGGAIILEMLASIFPRVRLRLVYLSFWKEKYYFSKLNDASLALVKSICSIHVCALKRPVIIFTDAYIEGENENSAELLLEAKMLGAICVKDDLSHVKKNRFGLRKYFLIDETATGNLHALADLTNFNNSTYLKEAEIYFFTNDDAYVQVEEGIRSKLTSDLNFSEKELPVFIPIQSYRNLIANLLTDIPLYEPLIGKARDANGDQDLTVTILGTGCIGTEMFLTTYWLGQILNCNLKINVLSQESEEAFWDKIDYINPEIRHTTIEGDPILRINRKGDMAKVYCKVEYRQCDIISSAFISCLTEQNKNILDTDYFLVSLGSDEDNISVANTVKRYIGQYHIQANKALKTVIAYVVYDSELSKTLNRKKHFNFVNDRADVYMQAVGSLNDVYSVHNVFMTEYESLAQETHDAYISIQNREKRAKTHNDRMNDDYKHWANLARGMHIKYKAYSMGMQNFSLFDYPDCEAAYREAQSKVYAEYKRVATGEFEFASTDDENTHLRLLHAMAWLEHRRWNAFTRVKGFRGTTDYDTYGISGVMGSYKQMALKLHPCLVESDHNGIKAQISTKGIIDKETVFQCEGNSEFDLLDDLSYDLYKKKLNHYDLKQYDYPKYDFKE